MNIDEFKQKLRNQTLPVVVDVWAPWCGPCRMVEPSLHKLGQEYSGRVDLWKVNADESGELVRKMGIYGIPTMLVFRGEQEIMRSTGAQPPSSLAKLFESALTGEPAQITGISFAQRLLRIALSLGLIFITWSQNLSLLWYGVGGVILFTAVYDRCPIWQALSPRLAKLIRRGLPSV